jgi:hypothetical protein
MISANNEGRGGEPWSERARCRPRRVRDRVPAAHPARLRDDRFRDGVHREGARQAVVANFGSDTACPVTGSIASDASRKVICLTKDRVGESEADTRVKIVFTGLNQIGDSLMVCAERPLSSATGIFDPVLDGHVLTSKVEMRIEKVDAELLAAEETPLSGSDWSWCV